VQDGTLEKLVQKRYESFTSGLGAKIEVSCPYLSLSAVTTSEDSSGFFVPTLQISAVEKTEHAFHFGLS
jgi:xylose isomerase